MSCVGRAGVTGSFYSQFNVGAVITWQSVTVITCFTNHSLTSRGEMLWVEWAVVAVCKPTCQPTSTVLLLSILLLSQICSINCHWSFHAMVLFTDLVWRRLKHRFTTSRWLRSLIAALFFYIRFNDLLSSMLLLTVNAMSSLSLTLLIRRTPGSGLCPSAASHVCP